MERVGKYDPDVMDALRVLQSPPAGPELLAFVNETLTRLKELEQADRIHREKLAVVSTRLDRVEVSTDSDTKSAEDIRRMAEEVDAWLKAREASWPKLEKLA